MAHGQQHECTVNLYPVRYPDGEIRYVSGPEVMAALIVNALASIRPGTLLLCGLGAAVVAIAFAGDLACPGLALVRRLLAGRIRDRGLRGDDR